MSSGLRWGSIRNLSKPAQKLVEQLAVDRESLEMLDTIKKGKHLLYSLQVSVMNLIGYIEPIVVGIH